MTDLPDAQAKCLKCHHERRFFYHRPEADNEPRCWYEDEDGFCGCKCSPDSASVPDGNWTGEFQGTYDDGKTTEQTAREFDEIDKELDAPDAQAEAREIVERFNIDSCEWTDHPETELINTIATALQAARDENARLRARLYAVSTREGSCSHSTACSIWGDDGQGNTADFGSSLPCNCGALINWEKKQANELRAQLAERDRIHKTEVAAIRGSIEGALDVLSEGHKYQLAERDAELAQWQTCVETANAWGLQAVQERNDARAQLSTRYNEGLERAAEMATAAYAYNLAKDIRAAREK